MIRIQGTLFVKRIKQSRNGPFCVADLATDFGEFKVKDPMLDQFAEGEYHGIVWISEIYLAQYVSFGRGVTELRARLHDLQVDTESDAPSKAPVDSEPDPLDEPPPTRASRAEPGTAKGKTKLPTLRTRKNAGPPAQAADAQSNDAERALFGDEIHAQVQERKAVKLDPTIDDRARFRAQTQRLRQLGYTFDAKTQTWSHQA